LALVPFWKFFHSSALIRIPLAVFNFAGGLATYWIVCSYGKGISLILMGLSMFLLSAALFIFKNELALRYEMEVKKSIAGGDSR